ncbi:MAG: DUF4124 domain-containing protein [Azoarcus sp.]|jgi:hypothetical protein|nr:DUF4124 domain-containing protein [Azoarcus sp.]
MKPSVRFAMFVLALALGQSASAEIYQWKDKDGRAHFSDMPPPQDAVEARTLETPALPRPMAADEQESTVEEGSDKPAAPASAIPAAAPAKSLAERELEFRQRRAAAAESRAKADEEAARAARRAQDCERARAQHAVLASGQRVARPTGDGGRAFLDDAEREAETARIQESIDRLCTGQ